MSNIWGTCQTVPGDNNQSKEISQNDSGILHQKFVFLGKQRHKLTYQLLSLIPEIYEQKIYKAHGFQTIYEYTGKLAGLSHGVVEKTLRLNKKLVDKPFLKEIIAKEGVHKVNLVAGIATPETDKIFAEKVECMSKAGLQELSKELRNKSENGYSDFSDSLFGAVICKTTPQSNEPKLSIDLDEEMQILFFKLKKKMGENMSNKEALRQILKQLNNGLAETRGEEKALVLHPLNSVS